MVKAKKTTKKAPKAGLSFKPATVTKRLIEVLPERAADVLTRRYGLGSDKNRMTLEAIGSIYGITRERVRQIENHALKTIRESEQYEKESATFNELEELIHRMGAVVPESNLLNTVSKDDSARNHVHFLLVLGHPFVHVKENEDFAHRWYVDCDVADGVQDALKNLYEGISDDSLLAESEIIDMFLKRLKDVSHQYRDEEILKRWLSISKKVGRNPLGDWGRSESPNISPRGIRDYAYLVILQHGSPLHFSEVAQRIGDLFEKKAHKATTHNELIKDERFVLVGRGLYALSEWGYLEGVVKDVIKTVLKQHGSLTREEIIDKVLKERYVKDNTIVVNLQDDAMFSKDKEGRYSLV